MKAVTNTMGPRERPESLLHPKVTVAFAARSTPGTRPTTRQSSIEDQIRNCREAAARKGWVVIEEYIFSDSEKTGTTMHGRSGLQRS
jgi:hypothetical protein